MDAEVVTDERTKVNEIPEEVKVNPVTEDNAVIVDNNVKDYTDVDSQQENSIFPDMEEPEIGIV
jgi:hypothetical protein